MKKVNVISMMFVLGLLASCANSSTSSSSVSSSSSSSTLSSSLSSSSTSSSTVKPSTSSSSSVKPSTSSASSSTSSSTNVSNLSAFDLDADMETASLKWNKDNLNTQRNYRAYIQKENSEYEEIDSELIREYDEYYRVDALGLTTGNYRFKIETYIDNKLVDTYVSSYVDVIPHVREGFAFKNGAVGAYNLDGTLKDNAVVLYVDNYNKDTITMDVKTGSSYEKKVGLLDILNGYKKGKETRPLNVRCIGNITDLAAFATYSDAKGDIVVENNNNANSPITIEGVGEDTYFNGFGIRIKNASNIEVRNIGFMLTNSTEGDNVSLQQNNNYVWVHNNDMFYGLPGKDADQDKGDGALDCKKSNYVTFSFNHFFDSGKSNLLGLSEESHDYYITYHHNWYDHSDSRHPRVRYYNAHIYNNYYDGNSKYGMGSTLGSSLFSEANYFRNCKRPMMISMQGTDIAGGEGTFSKEDGGIIKSYNNKMVGTYTYSPYSSTNTIEFDAYEVSNRDEKVPNTVTSKQGGNTYSNFDTDANMYSYNVQTPDEALETVKEYAGRINGGDIKFEFKAEDDSSYTANAALMSLLKNYQSSLILKDENGEEIEDNPNGGDNPVVETKYADGKSFDFSKTINDESGVFKNTGEKYNSRSSEVTVDGVTYKSGLKMESSTQLSFELQEKATLTIIVSARYEDPTNIKIDGEEYSIDAGAAVGYKITLELEKGVHTINRGNKESVLYYISLS